MNHSTFDTIVIGGGPAGITASMRSAERGKTTLLIEKNNALGKKLAITGKGRCNITNNTDIQGLIDNIPGNGSFLYSSLNTFSNKDLLMLLNNNGLKTRVERGGRVFPVSDSSRDVVKTIEKICRKSGVIIKTDSKAAEIHVANGRVKGIITECGRELQCRAVILATGGMSYPSTGSTGDGYRLAGNLGHTVIEPRPALVPLNTREKFVRELQGLTLKNVSVKFTDGGGNTFYTDFGEVLFTHFGVSGPVILSGSRYVAGHGTSEICISIDLKPALSHERLDARVARDFVKYGRKNFKNSLCDLLPRKMIPVITRLSGIPDNKPVNQITKNERIALVSILKDLRFHITGPRPIEEAIVTAGGVNLAEVEPYTMQSKIVDGLYFAGEILDVDGYTGGYNLTIAFSTGYTAGNSC